jgi:filamentous hemagglutinin family protein
VVAGTAAIATTGNTMNVNQTSQRAVVNWSSFDVGSQATVNFNQPNAAAATLNYVNSASKSMINGAVNANGQVIFINNNGVVFGRGAEVNVGGMIATTMNTSAADFMAGKDIQVYEGGDTGKIINKGNITGNNINSYIALMAPQVKNSGVITATLGGNNAIALVSGQKVTLKFSGSQFVNVSVDASVVNSLISNKLLINAGGGQVIIAANAAQNLMSSLIKNTGTISASDISTVGGKVTLTADTIDQSGVIEANSAQNAGGKISLRGNTITLARDSKTSATGATAGGDISIGVNYIGEQNDKNIQKSIKNNDLANIVTVESNAVIDASATQNGNGGSINLWSRTSTSVAGALYARGGAQGGNGGFIETSSVGNVDIKQGLIVDTSSSNGVSSSPGRWVIDPTTLIIDSVAASAISNALNTTSVTLDAIGSACSAFGGSCIQSETALIRILAGADIYSSNTATSLSLIATGGQIDINSNITAGAVYAVAQTINVNGSINTNGGSNSNIYLAGAIINILGNINSNGNGQNSNTNTTSSSLNTINTSTANNRRNGSTTNNQNTLTADGNNYISNGGLINIFATGDINIGSTSINTTANLNINPNSYISANGVHGGSIAIISTAGKVNINAVIDTLGKSGNAGKIDIAGKVETNLTNALISTEGLSQGGLLNLGQINNLGNGTILAPPATAPPALLTFVQNTVSAALLNSNNGITSSSIIIDSQTGIHAPNGNIVVFGDQIQVNHSSIIADRGVIIIGREGYSSGGLSKLTAVSNSTLIAHKVETSAELLGTEAVTVLASEWLLDPTNVTIAAGAAGGSTGGLLASALANAGVITITAGDIQAAINAGTSVNVVASGSITQSGALSFANSSGTAATLTLDNTSGSKKAMTLSGGITATGSSLTNIVAKTAGGQIVISGAVNVTGAVTLDNTYAVGGSESGFINETNGLTYIGAVAGSNWGVKNTGTITAKTISVTAANSGHTNMGFWAAANLTASGDINVYATNQFAQASAGGGSSAFYTNSALNITSTGGTVNIIGKVQGTSANYSSGGIQFANATAAATVNITANKISLAGYSTNSAGDTSTTGIGINSNFTKFTINAGADYSAGGPAISFYGSSIVGAGRGLRITNGTITNNASGGDVLLVANNNIFNSNNIVVATNNTANASKVLFDTTSGNSTGTIENNGAITSTGGTTATGSNLTNILVKSSGGKIFSNGTINISGDITVSNRYNVGGTNSTFINQYNASANTATYVQTTAGVTITAGISAKNINIYGAYNGYLSSAVWLQANLTATGNINLAGYHSLAAAAGNNNGSAGIYTNGALNFNAGGTFSVDGNVNSTVAGLSGIGVYLWAGLGTAKLNVIANKIQILGSSTNTSAGGDTTATSLNLANGVNFTIRNSNDYVNGGEAFSFRSTVVTNLGRGIRISNGSITNNSNGGDIVFVSNGSIGTFVPISLAKNTSTVATKVLYDTTTATSTGFIDNTGAITVAVDSTSAVNLIQKSNGGRISNGAGAINVSGFIDIDNTNGSTSTATVLNSNGVTITGAMTAGALAGDNAITINAIASGTGIGISDTAAITAVTGLVSLTSKSATGASISLSSTSTVNSAGGISIIGTSSQAFATADTAGAYGAVSVLGQVTNTGAGGVLVQSTANTATGAITDSGAGGISITGGYNIAAGTVTGGTITAVGALNNTNGGVISLSMAQPTSATGGAIEDAAGVTNAVASVGTNVTYSLRGGVMNLAYAGVNNVNYRSPLTPATISVQLLESYVTTYGVAFTDAAPQAWIKNAANSAVTVSGGGAFGASPTASSVLGSLSLSSINGVATIAANRVGGPTTLVTGDILSTFGPVTITAPAAGKGTYTVNPATLTITSKSSSSAYNGVTTFNALTQAGYSVAGLISTIGGTPTGDAVTSTTSAINVNTSSGAAVTGSSVATAGTFSVIESLAQGSNLNNYTINYVRSTFDVTPAALTITAANDSKTYGSTTTNAGIAYNASGVKTTSADGFTISGLLGSDAVNTVTLSSLTGAIAAASASITPYAITPSAAAGSGLSNYSINYINAGLTINKAVLTITNPTMVYNGTTTFAAGTPGTTATVTGVGGQPFTLGGSATMTNPNVLGGSNITSTAGLTFTGVGSSNYELPASIANVVITPAPLTVTLAPQTKTYDSTTGAVLTAGTSSTNGSYTIGGFVSGQGAFITQTSGVYNFANASTSGLTSVATTVSTTLSPSNWTANSGTSLSNYSLPTTVSATGTITKAPLAILANDVSTFVNTQPAAGNLTYVVSGLVGTDTPGSAFTVAPAAALAPDASLTTAGVFAGKVIPSVTAPNYTVTATPGTLTVLGSNAILVAVGTTSKVYGTYNSTQTANIQADIAALSTPIVTVQYKPAISGVVDLAVSRNNGIWTAVDGIAGNSATYTFTVTPTISTANYSTANYLRVGSYALVPANLALASGSTANCVSCSVSYTSGTLTITPAQLLATVTPGAMTYNANTAITSTTVLSGAGVFAGVPSGVSGVTTLTAASPNAGVTAINNGGTLLSGPDAANFTVTTTVLVPQAAGGPTNGVAAPGTATTDGSGYTINIAKAPLVYSGVVRSSVYTSNAQTNTGATLTSGTLYSTDNFTIAGYASATNVSQGTVADILVATPAGSTVANNYAITYNHGSLTITGAPLIITATADSKTYGSTTTNSGIAYNASGVKTLTADGYTVGGLIGSDAVSSVTLSSTGALAAANVVDSPYAITPSVAAGTGLGNYTISYVNGVMTVNPAVLSIANATMVYNSTTTFAPGVSDATTTFAGVNGQTVTLGGSATMTNANVLGTSAINNTAGLTVVGVSGGVLASNYALPTSIANVDITPAPIMYTGQNTTTVFNNTLQTNNGATLTTGTVFGSDGFTISGYATKTDVSRVGNIASGALSSSPDALIATAIGATNPNNYLITFVQGGLTITPAPLTATVTPAALIYNGSGVIASTTALSGFVGGATEVTGATALTAASPNAGVQTINNGGTTLTGNDSLNYAVSNTVLATTTGAGANGVAPVSPTPAGGGYTIDIARRLLVYTGQVTTSPYSGAEQTNAIASLTTGTVVSGQSFTLGGYAKATNVSQGIVVDQLAATPGANTLSANYDIRYVNGSIKITPLALSVSITTVPNSGAKVYDSTTAATLTAGTSTNPGSYAITGFVGGQGAYITQAAGTYNSPNVAGATTITAALTPSVWTTTGSTDLSNYALPTSITAPGSITPAPLSISANNAATFVGVTPTNLTYVVSGLVGTDTPGSAFTVAPTVSLNSTGTTGLATAGTYAGSLIPAVSAPNYTVTPTAGTLTVVGNSILVVSVGTTSQVFGTYNQTQVENGTISKAAPNVTVGYCTNCSDAAVIADPTLRSVVNLSVNPPTTGTSPSTSLWTASDSIAVGTSAQGIYNFTVTPTVAGGSYSTGNYLKVGNYALVPGNVTTVAGQTTNYQGTPIYTSGNLNITPLTLTYGAAYPTQTYNGLTAINSLALAPTNLPVGITGITSVVGSGNFTSPNASATAAYTINNALISGPDAANFAFAGASGATGVINKAALEYAGVVRTSVFNGATQTNSGATLTSGTIATGESFTVGGYAQQRNVLATPTPDVLVATPGANTLASNYTISYNHGSLRITPAPLTATVTAGGLTYNGSNAISSTTVLTGFVGGATGVAGATTLTAATANAGVQTIINDGTVLAGTESANYSVTNTVLASTASNGVVAVNAAPNGSGYTIDIAKAPLTYTSSDTSVTYNGAIQTNAPATLTSGSFAAGQGVTISGYAAATTAYEMPLDDLVATANSGTNLSNYAITFVNGSLTINPAPLTISGLAANNKTFDRNTNAVISGTPTLAGQIFAGDDVAIESGSVTQGVFASSSVSRTNPTPVSVNLDGFVLSNSNYYIQGPTQPLAARINAVVTTTAPPQNPAPAPQPVTPAPQPAAPQEPEAKELNNMVLLARQNESQAFLQSTLVQTKPNDMRKLNLLFVRDNESRTEYLNVLPVPSSGAFKFPIPDQITQELIVLSGEHVTVVGAPASFYGHKLLRLPDQSVVKASLADGSALPQGIQFNAADMTFSVPKLSEVNLPIYVKLSLVRGNAALSEKTLLVEE